jgi:hypothetical protein
MLLFTRKNAEGSEKAQTAAAIPNVSKEYKAIGALAANPAIFRSRKASQKRLAEIKKKTKISPVTNPESMRTISAHISRMMITPASNIYSSLWSYDSLSASATWNSLLRRLRGFDGFRISVTHYYGQRREL